ncbi:Threonine dehydratase [Pyrenophora tritici-repentis]|nr:Threonine dehydratase [Pyrenophora tritici-repentis]KAI0605764.1 Threonine dehydratase [Pyrenophora tritici-repentis]KAI0617439.1 Threonine dehydratase [Pyrenophora tritici-repentis]
MMTDREDYIQPKTLENGTRSLTLIDCTINPSSSNGNAPSTANNSAVPAAFLLPTGYPDYIRLILTSRVYEVAIETPLTHATKLSNCLKCTVLLKREDLQPLFSCKLRGVYNKMAQLNHRDHWRGVIACSTGNHAQNVAYSARHIKLPSIVVMPSDTPEIKQNNVSRFGCSVVLHGNSFDAARQEAARLKTLHGLVSISPSDPYVIAGQGTIGMEILRQTISQNLTAVFCCVGGGGLIAGVGIYIKRIAPHVKIIGVQHYDINDETTSIETGKRVVLTEAWLFANSASIGEETSRICREVVDEVVQVTTDETYAATKDMFEETHSVFEPIGAFALAGLKKWVSRNPSPNCEHSLVAVASGANMDFDDMRFVAERAATGTVADGATSHSTTLLRT